ncbi:hypothetical protein E8E13_005955 [Curvularia kusanoi]|uniref:Uncharacterized protein n=1 Tax=Curvularia kusanoi TaxID=90978 RepID=A0A9P4T812_CURKU|nr:hypothetical protein E8E13_005955 [Curvularia kusanoi]
MLEAIPPHRPLAYLLCTTTTMHQDLDRLQSLQHLSQDQQLEANPNLISPTLHQDEDEPEGLEIRKRYPALIDRTLSKRRTVDANIPSGKITLTAPNQPRSGLLYTGKRKNNPKNVFDFKDNKLGSRIVKNFKAILKPTNEFATEHIIELQTIALFIEYAVKQNPALDGFFKTEWSKKRSDTSIQNRPGKPSYKLDGQDSLMALVFEPFGSLQNPTHFVLCESQINLFKERIWGAEKALMDKKLYEAAVKEGMTGAIQSSVFLSAIRLTLGVYSYMNSPDVMAIMRIINDNIKLELSNAAILSGKPNIDLVPIWNTFLADRFTKAENWGVQRLKARMPETKAEIQSAMTKYRTLYRKLKQQEGSANAAQYAKSQKTKQTQLEKTLADQKAVVVATQGKLDTLRKSRKGKTDAQKKVITQQMDIAKKDLKNELKKQGLIQREIHELYSDSVQQILQNLQADNTRIEDWETKSSEIRTRKLQENISTSRRT